MMKIKKKKKSGKPIIKESMVKLKRENHKLKEENRILRDLLKSNQGTSLRKRTKGYSTRYSREVD